jgi:hypothetical protein
VFIIFKTTKNNNFPLRS